MNWLLLLVIGLALGPLGAVIWWWVRSKKAEERKVSAVSKMDRYVNRRVEQRRTGPRHALPDGIDATLPGYLIAERPATASRYANG
jgi:hypothetical protein